MFELQEEVSELKAIKDIEDKIQEISASIKLVSDGIQGLIIACHVYALYI
jgi:hypothetical protein